MYYFAEDLLVMIMRSKENTEDKTQTAQYELEITEQRIFLCGTFSILTIHIPTSYGTI